jgi:hypothetical protein
MKVKAMLQSYQAAAAPGKRYQMRVVRCFAVGRALLPDE